MYIDVLNYKHGSDRTIEPDTGRVPDCDSSRGKNAVPVQKPPHRPRKAADLIWTVSTWPKGGPRGPVVTSAALQILARLGERAMEF
jgi:hypothetical protein